MAGRNSGIISFKILILPMGKLRPREGLTHHSHGFQGLMTTSRALRGPPRLKPRPHPVSQSWTLESKTPGLSPDSIIS